MRTAAILLRRVILLLAIALAPAGAVFAQETIRLANSSDARDLYQQAEILLADGRTFNAYELLRSYEPDLAGDPYFDYLLGVASLDSGRTGEAILNLQRAAAAAPDFAGARLELARAYYESGEYSEARLMFVALLGENPPPAVHDAIRGYINAIDSRSQAAPSQFSPYGEFFAGHDNNANGSTDDQQFLGFALSPENQATKSSFFEVAGGFDWSLPRTSGFGWLLGARASYRENPNADFVDSGIVSGLSGANWRGAAFFGRAAINAYVASRDGDANENYAGIDLLLGRNLNDRWDLSFAVRSGTLRYDDSIQVLDVNRSIVTVMTSYRIAPRARLSFEVIGGSDSEQENGSPYGNSKFGGRVALATPIGEASTLFASAGSLTSDYDGLFFGAAREDQQTSALLQLEYRNVWVDGLTLAPRLRYVDNKSDVDLYTYDRTEIGLLIRWTPK